MKTGFNMPARRAMLYVPGDDLHKIEKAAALGVDSVCLDIEDGVAILRKDAARQSIASALMEVDFAHSERLVRINPVGSTHWQSDLAAVLDSKPDGIVLPKVDDAAPILAVDERMGAAEAAHGWSAGSLALLVIVETALAFVNLREICTAVQRLQALIFGAEDFAASVGATRTPAGLEVLHARSVLVLHAAAFGLQAIDMVSVDFTDLEGLGRSACEGAALGFTGKQIIHPRQVQPVQEAFTPGDEDVRRARRIVDEFDLWQAQGKGAFALDGTMVDMPVVKAARQVLERARAAGKV